MASFAFELVSPERLLLSVQADEVTVPGVEGEFTVLAQHAPFITVLRPGFVTVRAEGNVQRLYVRGGFAEVNPEGLTILADYAVPAAEFGALLPREIELAQAGLDSAVGDEARMKAEQRLAWVRDLGPHEEVHHATFH